MTAIDTNAFISLWQPDEATNRPAREAIDKALSMGRVTVSLVVYAELLAAPGRSEAMLDRFFSDAGIQVDWQLSEAATRLAGRVFQAYAKRRRDSSGAHPRRIAADFLIGAHAVSSADSLLTLDGNFYESNYPQLNVLTF